MSEGYIYIMLNRAFQNDHYKIGMTTNAPEARARELSSATGVPRGFEVLYEQRVTDARKPSDFCIIGFTGTDWRVIGSFLISR